MKGRGTKGYLRAITIILPERLVVLLPQALPVRLDLLLDVGVVQSGGGYNL